MHPVTSASIAVSAEPPSVGALAGSSALDEHPKTSSEPRTRAAA
jgi:hypothetical protein